MGFGHRVYKVRDPRADVLASGGRADVHAGAATCRSTRWRARSKPTALRLLEEYKPGRRLQTNVEFYTALLLHGLGLDVRSSRRRSPSAGSAAGSRTRSSSGARTASSGRSRSTSVPRDRSWLPLAAPQNHLTRAADSARVCR